MKPITPEFRRGVRAVLRLIDNYDLPDEAYMWLRRRIRELLAERKKSK